MSTTKTKPVTFSQKMMRLIRLNILAIAISTGVSVYFVFHYCEFLLPIKYPIKNFFNDLIPFLIFTLLFLAFSKVELKKMKPRRWHYLLSLFQLGASLGITLYLAFIAPQSSFRIELEGALACIICPTAAAATVITGKLGGDESSLTTYTILSNLVAAIGIPAFFPLIKLNYDVNFITEFLLIMSKVFPLVILPLLLAQFVRYFLKPINIFICEKLREFNFYLWAFTLSTISATAVSNLMNSNESNAILFNLAMVGLFTTIFQFALGKVIGHLEGQRISAGQALGQKNQVFGIWVALTYLSPTASIAPGCYILWQNIINSWQLWYREKKQLSYTDKID